MAMITNDWLDAIVQLPNNESFPSHTTEIYLIL